MENAGTNHLDALLAAARPPGSDEYSLDYQEFVRLYWKYRGLLRERERNNSFWKATNENLRLAYEKLDDQERELEKAYAIIQEDLRVANQIQDALLPTLSPQLERQLEVAVYHRQLSQVGGDYYDFFETSSGRYAVGLFDISGHGVSAALAMALLRSQLIQAATNLSSPKAVADEVNSRVINFLRRVKKYATVNLVLFRPHSIRYVCGGGNGLLIHHDRAFTFTKRDHFLGLRDRPFNEHMLPFADGDLLAMYTDGIVEAQDEEENDYTVRRLNDLIRRRSERDVKDIMAECVEDFFAFCPEPQDDVTLLIMRKKANGY